MWPYGCYGDNKVVEKGNKTDSKVTVDNTKAETFLRINAIN